VNYLLMEFQLISTNSPTPILHRLPVTYHYLPITDHRLLVTDFRFNKFHLS